jgi:hypothetical protein
MQFLFTKMEGAPSFFTAFLKSSSSLPKGISSSFPVSSGRSAWRVTLASSSGFVHEPEAPRQQSHVTRIEEVLATALEQSGDTMVFIRVAFNVV